MILSWKAPTYYSEQLIGSYDIESGSYETAGSNFDYLSLLAGKPYPLNMDKPKVYFPCKKKKLLAYDCLWLLGGVPLVTERLANFLTHQSAQDIQLIQPAVVIADGEEVDEAFFIVNSINTVNAIDQWQSAAERDDDGSIIYFTKTWCLDDAAGMRGIAREPESGDLLISQQLADSMIEKKFKSNKGLGFYIANRTFVPYKNQA